jgi:hypothetical protein
MKWLKQVFAQRYNRADGRIGHIWGDRYGSRIVEGEGEVEVEEAEEGREAAAGVRPQDGETTIPSAFPLIFPLPPAPAPG